MQVKKQPLGPYIEQWTGLKLGKEYDKAVYCHPVYLTYMQSTSCEMPGLDEAQVGIKLACRDSTRDKGHEEGGSAYAKAGSSFRSPPGNSRAYTPQTRVCLLSACAFT